MKNCQFKPTTEPDDLGRVRYACALPDCPSQAFTNRPPERIVANCTGGKSGPCIHLGNERRRVDCESCSGRVKVKVFACDIHGECVIKKHVNGLRSCRGCADYEQ